MIERKNPDSWKTQSYAVGLIGGVVFGLLAAYMFTRSAEEDMRTRGAESREPIPTMSYLSIALAGVALMRQIAELGKTKKK
jgi:H+/Cl- antiporter ClcA